MMKLLLHVTALVAVVIGAPVQDTDKATGPLLRVKRSDEVVMFGNHQNVDDDTKVKKWASDGDDETVFDQNANMESKTAAAENLADNPDIKDADDAMADNGDLTVAQLLAEEVAKEDEEAEKGGEIDEQLEEVAKEDEEVPLEDPSEENNQVDAGDSGELLSEQNEEENALALPDWRMLFDSYYNNHNQLPLRKRRSTLKARTQRSINAFTADGMNMAKADKKAMRVKRDLTADDIEALLALESAGGNGYELPEEFYGEEAEEEDPWSRLEDDNGAYGVYEPYDEEIAEETAFPVSEDEIERAKERLEMLDLLEENPGVLEDLRGYFEEGGEEPYEEEPYEEEPYELGYPGYPEDEVPYEEMFEEEQEEEPEIEYRSIFYDGQPGIFIPVKRQYISMVPGVRKRSFYPYSEEPQGHWGAFVDQEEKRNAEAYERLYRLARALGSERDYRKK